jgi:hypothetical protein
VGSQVKLTSSDNQVFEVDEEIANESQTVKNMIEGEAPAGLATAAAQQQQPSHALCAVLAALKHCERSALP